jgi:Tfp pilus assembly protein PilO
MELQNLPWYGQFLIFLLIGGIIFAIFYYAYFQEGQTKIKQISSQIETLEKDIRVLYVKKERIGQMEAEVKRSQAILEKLKEILPEKKEISQILRRIHTLILTEKLKIQNFTTQGDRRKDIYVEHPVRISLDCNYHNLGMFFDQLSKLKKIYIVSNLTLKPLSRVTRTYTSRATFTASTFTFIERKQQTGKKR